MEPQSSIRIIGGKWRSRKVSFITKQDLRPTPDRIRETLFNWLAPDIIGARCLDLYAGSGAMGLEALSRGAQSVTAIELDRECCQKIIENKTTLQADGLEVLNKNVLDWLANQKFTADIVFIDPPYKQQLLAITMQVLEEHNWLRIGSLIYFEQDKPLASNELPENWQLLREKKAGKVYYFLASKER